jgi:hypothetical protein
MGADHTAVFVQKLRVLSFECPMSIGTGIYLRAFSFSIKQQCSSRGSLDRRRRLFPPEQNNRVRNKTESNHSSQHIPMPLTSPACSENARKAVCCVDSTQVTKTWTRIHAAFFNLQSIRGVNCPQTQFNVHRRTPLNAAQLGHAGSGLGHAGSGWGSGPNWGAGGRGGRSGRRLTQIKGDVLSCLGFHVRLI